MSTVEERTHKLGTIFKFPGFEGYFVLARMSLPGLPIGEYFFNLISLSDGNVKTETWGSPVSGNVEIPEYTWTRGGPPTVVHVPTTHYGSETDNLRVLNLIKHDDLLGKSYGKNLNRELIKSLEDI